MKLVAILIAFSGCALAGLRLSQRLAGRAALLASLREDLDTLLNAVRASRKPFAVLVAERPSLKHGPLYAQYLALRQTLTPDAAWQTLWNQPVGAGPARPQTQPTVGATIGRPLWAYETLTDEEQNAVRDILAAFTTSDCDTIARRGAETLALLNERAKAAAAESNAKGRVYRSIGLLLGAALAIVML